MKRAKQGIWEARGFTLIEVLIAVTLAAAVLGAIAGTLVLAERARKEAGGALLELYEAEKAMDMLRRELSAAKGPIKVMDREHFGKQASGLSFTAFSPQSGVIASISYRVDEKMGELLLVKEQSVAGRPASSAVLLEGIEGFVVEAAAGGQWFRTWQEEVPPESVRVILKLSQGGAAVELQDTLSTRIGRPL